MMHPIALARNYHQPRLAVALRQLFRAAAGRSLATAAFVDIAEISALCAGTKAIANTKEHAFACTNCGKCCKELSASIMLDSADFVRLRLSGKQYEKIAESTRLRLGQFSIETLMTPSMKRRFTSYCKELGLRFNAESGVLPVAYMNPSIFLGEPQCGFAVAKPGDSGRLLCSLGPEFMPTACVLYPYGELVPAVDREAVKCSTLWPGLPSGIHNALQRVPQSHEMVYSLDLVGCEGVTQTEGGAIARSLPVYEKANDLKSRRKAYEQWLFLMQAIANMQLVEQLQEIDSTSLGRHGSSARQQRRARVRAKLAGEFATAAFVTRLSSILYGLPHTDTAHRTPIDGQNAQRAWDEQWPAMEQAALHTARETQAVLAARHASNETPGNTAKRIVALCNQLGGS